MKSGNLNFLEPSGPLQACNGTALPFYWWRQHSVQYRKTDWWSWRGGDWILACPHLVKQFMKGAVGNVIPMLKHNMIGLRTHQSCNQDVNQVLSEQGDNVQAQSPARGSQYSVMMHKIQKLFSGDLRALASYFRDWESLLRQSRWWTKGTGKCFCWVLQFSLLVFILLTLHTWSLIIQGMNSGPVGGHIATECSLIPSKE